MERALGIGTVRQELKMALSWSRRGSGPRTMPFSVSFWAGTGQVPTGD